MRLWSIHPRYLDGKGLVALWREGLLAQSVLCGRTQGYRRHPQLERFLGSDDPVAAVATYLGHVADEADGRGYQFDRARIATYGRGVDIDITTGQARYEFEHLLRKLRSRDPARYGRLTKATTIDLHPMFKAVPGGTAEWEKIA